MGWKDWPSWIKAGIIAGSIAFAICLAAIISILNIHYYDQGEQFAFARFYLPLFFVSITILGIFIGWIYGKIKNRS